MGNPPPLAPSLEISQAERRRDRIEKIKQEERPEGNREESSLTHVENPSLTLEFHSNKITTINPEEQDSDPYPEFPEYDSEPEISASLLAKHFEGLSLSAREAVGCSTRKVKFSFFTSTIGE